MLSSWCQLRFPIHAGWWRVAPRLIATLGAWWLLYRSLPFLASWYTYGVLRFPGGTVRPFSLGGACCLPGDIEGNLSDRARAGRAVEFFLFQAPHALLLLVLAVFVMGIVRSYFTPEQTRRWLIGRKTGWASLLAALLGILTPFCSCSAVPLFVGFVTAGVPLRVTFSFLTSAPLVNEIALVLLADLFGWKAALLYAVTGVGIALVTGWVLDRLGMERWVEDWVFKPRRASGVSISRPMQPEDRVRAGKVAVQQIVGKVWPYVIVGLLVGTYIHAGLSRDSLVALLGSEHWWSVLLAVVVGIPIYSNAAGIIPIASALLEKGVPLGTVLAFTMAVVGLSLPEFIILRKVLKLRLLITFAGVVAVGITIVGYLFNAVIGGGI